MSWTEVDSPIGPIVLVGDDDGLTGLFMADHRYKPADHTFGEPDDVPFTEVAAQLREYFAGTRTGFDVPLAPVGTPFQREVWTLLRQIPYGETTTYGELAAQLGRPNAARAVGMANGRNPISIIVPCHRVVGSTGDLTGYGGGLPRKRFLLDLEHAGVAAVGG
jgi:methylated-DNA-[protein]-cysteine S-methyltransferase